MGVKMDVPREVALGVHGSGLFWWKKTRGSVGGGGAIEPMWSSKEPTEVEDVGRDLGVGALTCWTSRCIRSAEAGRLELRLSACSMVKVTSCGTSSILRRFSSGLRQFRT